MEIAAWIIWVSIALICIIIEIFTAGFAVMCFSFGAAAAAIGDACSLGIGWQLLLFAVFSGLALAFVRPAVIKAFYKKDKEVKTNVDAIIGRKGRVSDAISAGSGRVALDGDDWKAVSVDGSDIAKGEEVEILSRDGLTVSVRALRASKEE